jgi:arabinan endo-1,5-alpha-L-arabinosidase
MLFVIRRDLYRQQSDMERYVVTCVKILTNGAWFLCCLCASLVFFACSEDNEPKEVPPPVNPPAGEEPEFNIEDIEDTYPDLAPFELHPQWGPYNVHDPSIIKEGDYFYCFSTDAGFGIDVRLGIQIRKSKDLVEWKFEGWVFNKLPPKGAAYITASGGTPFNSLWAPYVIKVGEEFRLYYSLSSPTPRLSVIGLATSPSPEGPWTERDVVVHSSADNTVHTNAIDPTVIVDREGRHWMYYGSAWDGIYVLELDPATGLAKIPLSRGKRIAQRGFTDARVNGNIEAAEIIYHPELDKYYLFISYDWLQTKYNVRVGRSDSPEGPFYDFNGVDLNEEHDVVPMILAPYQFIGHGGWQGTGHCTVFEDDGQYYIAHQGRPGVNSYYMVLHVRKIFWMENGWPVVSPQRYAGIEQTPLTAGELEGTWERIVLHYQVVPGYAEEQVSPNFQFAVSMALDEGGTIDGNPDQRWSYEVGVLTLEFGDTTYKAIAERGRDWENKTESILFSGLNQEGVAIWGKKLN